MYQNKKFLAVIPARGGSKGIANKNLVKINGIPLIEFTIKEAKRSKYLDRIIVSTDDKKIAAFSRSCGVSIPFLRPPALAGDEAKVIDAVLHSLIQLKKVGECYDYVVVLQPTQPLRRCFHIDEAIEKLVTEGKCSLVSVTEVSEHPILMRSIDETGTLNNLLERDSTVRRQEFPKYYKVNGAIYINEVYCMNSTISLNDNKLPYIMKKKYDLDIDEPSDLELLKCLLDNGAIQI